MKNLRTTMLLVSLALAGGSAACINLDQAEQVKDLRILAMRVDPPEILFSFFHVFPPEQRGPLPLGPYPVNVQALVVDPQGRNVEMTIRLCPEDLEPQHDGCEGYTVRENAPAEENLAVVPLVTPRQTARPAELALGGEIAVPTFPFTFSDRALDYMLPHTEEGELNLFNALLFPSFPSFVMRAFVPDSPEVEVAFKRFTLALDIAPEGVPAELSAGIEDILESVVGVGFCPADTPQEADVQCVKRRVANRNPTILRTLYTTNGDFEARGDPTDPTSDGQLRDIVGRVRVEPGQSVRIRATTSPGDEEPYQAFSFDPQTQRLVLVNYREDMAFSWYTTVGSIERTTTSQFTRTADTSWSVSPDAPDGPASVWVIVRDQRGGVDWRRLDFEIVTPLSYGEESGPFGLPPL